MSTDTSTAAVTAPETCQVGLVAGTVQLDYSLPLHAPVSMMLTTLRQELKADLTRIGNAQALASLDQPHKIWCLARLNGTTLSGDKSLHESGVRNGDLLTLRAVPTAEGYKPIIEDVLDAVAEISRITYPDFSRASAHALSMALLLATAVVTSIVGIAAWQHRPGSYTPAAITAAAAVIAFAGAVIAVRKESTRTSYVLSIGASVTAAAAAVTAIPTIGSELTSANILAAASAAAMVSVLLMRMTGVGTTVHTMIVTVCLTAIVAAGLTLAIGVSAQRSAATAIGAAFILLALVPSLAESLGRIPLPHLPAPSDAPDEEDLSLSFILDDSDGDPIDHTRDDYVARARAANKYLTGLITGAVVTICAATAIMVSTPGQSYSYQCLALGIIAAITLAFRARTYRDRLTATITFTAAFGTAAALTWRLVTSTDSMLWQAGAMAVFLAVAVAGAILLSRVDQLQFTPITRRGFELIEQGLIIAIPILVLWIDGIYSLARNR